MNPPLITVAIDGYSSSGKSTMARRLAAATGYRYIDSGAMYRAVALYGLEHGSVSPDGTVDSDALVASLPGIAIDFVPQPDGSQHTLLNGRDVENEIRQLRVSNVVSPVSAIAEVRHALVAKQQEMGAGKGIVMDGRDIGTTVFPDAELKVFVDASAQTRAQRRLDEMIARGATVTFAEVLANVVHRDEIDRTRAESPLRRADDALTLDNSDMTPDEQDAWLLERFNETLSRLVR